MSLKDISYLELWQPLCSMEQDHLCNFSRKHHEEQYYEIILNLDQWSRRRCFEFEPVVQEEMSLKDISYLEL